MPVNHRVELWRISAVLWPKPPQEPFVSTKGSSDDFARRFSALIPLPWEATALL
jgi:hypothetical protein